MPEPEPVLSPTSKGKLGKSAVTVPLVSVEQVPEEEIIHIDDDRDPSPLQCMQQQIDHLLMPPPMATAPHVQQTPILPQHSRQPPKLPDRQEPTQRKRSLAE